MEDFEGRIRTMNYMYKLPIHEVPTLPDDVSDRLSKFKRIINKEISELDDIQSQVLQHDTPINILTAIADLLGDVVVYCRSEALKYGIPLEEVLQVIMDANESKLDESGHPIYDADGKFCKGPNTWSPEGRIGELLLSKGLFTVNPELFDHARISHEFAVRGTQTGRTSGTTPNDSNIPQCEDPR